MPSDARARQRSRWLVRVRARARSAASSAARSVAVRRPVEGEGEVVAVDVEAVAVVPDVAAGGVAREEDSKSGPRVRLRAFSIVRQALLEASASLLEVGVGREELVEAEPEPEPDVVVGGERITEARRRGRRGLWFVRVVEEEPLVVVSALLLASLVDWLCRLAQDVASPGTWVGERRCSSPVSLEGSCLGLAVIRRSSGKVSDHDVEASPPLLVVPLSGFGVPEELDRAPEPNMSPEV